MATVKIKFKDSGANPPAWIKNKNVQWKFTYTDSTGTEVILERTTPLVGAGELTVPDLDIAGSVEIWYKIDGKEGSVTVAKSPQGVCERNVNVKLTDAAAVVPVVPVAVVGAVPIVVPVAARAAIINEDRDWLTYESLFNRIRNRKSNKKYEMGLYIVQRKDVVVWFRDDLDDSTLNNLTAAFFPDYEPKEHLVHSNRIWEWKEIEDSSGPVKRILTPSRVRGLVASGKQYIVNLDTYVVLPYNFYDNSTSSRALGTKQLNPESKQLLTTLFWDFWKTASRSCVVRVKRVKDRGANWSPVTKPVGSEWVWNYAVGDPERTPAPYDNLDFLLDKPLDQSGWKLPGRVNSGDTIDVSLKTGVMFVGSEPQSGSGKKDFLDENWIVACLRSDYVAAVNKEMRGKGVTIETENPLVLTELLSITETNYRNANETRLMDGIQVRDLGPLDRTKIYLAPLNIPHIDIDLKEFKDEFACLDKESWREFWRKHWAASLGRVKALFLLRYGLQHINPNPQNYLIEFRKTEPTPTPTGRIVIRDLQDAAIHREVIWALYGKFSELPPEGERHRARLGELLQNVLEYEFEKVPDKSQETGTIDKTQNFGPPGTQFLWQRFSAFGSASKPESMKSHREANRWQLFLTAMAKWGRSHNRAYVRCVEQQLGVNLFEIDWGTIPRPERYLDQPEWNDKTSAMCIDYDSSLKSTGADPPIVHSVQTGAFPNMKEQPIGKQPQANWKTVFGADYPFDDHDAECERAALAAGTDVNAAKAARDKKMLGSNCMIVTGRNFKNPKITLGEKAVDRVLLTEDGTKVYFVPDGDSRVLYSRKVIPVAVTNYDGSNPTGTATNSHEAKTATDMGWEEITAKKVHDFLRSKDGQRAIRAYKNRSWQPAKPSFRIKIVDAKDVPIEEALVKLYFKSTARSLVDLTDAAGEIQIYKDVPQDCMVTVLDYSRYSGTFALKDIMGLGGSTLDLSQDEGIKIKYLE